MAAVRHFIEPHAESRFSDIAADRDRPTINRAGYRRFVNDEWQYLVLPEVFRREICAGLDYRRVARMLRERGLLLAETADHLTIKPRGLGRVYAIRESIDEN